MKYTKSSGAQGPWVKASELENGVQVKLVSETQPIEGEYGTQNVSKLRFKGNEEVYNCRLNQTTINGLIDAFGDDSKNWVDKVLTVQTERAMVGGRRVTVLYLIPQGFMLKENGEGFLEVVSEVKAADNPLEEIVPKARTPWRKGAVKTAVTGTEPVEPDYPEGPNPADIPW